MMIFVSVVNTGVDASLHALASSVKAETLLHVDGLVDAEMVAGGYKHSARLPNSVFELLLNLRELRVRS